MICQCKWLSRGHSFADWRKTPILDSDEFARGLPPSVIALRTGSVKHLRSFLSNLDNLHSHVAMSFPALRPPSFEVEQIEGDPGLVLHYRSERAGLAPMVVGLLKGLGRRFSEEISIRQTAHRGPDDHDVFRIDHVGAGASPKQ